MLAVHTFRYSPREDTAAAALEGRVDDASARRRSAAVRRSAAATGHARRTRAVGTHHQVVWDRVEAGVAHGISATYLDVVVTDAPGIRVGGLDTVQVEALDGNTLHARLVDGD